MNAIKANDTPSIIAAKYLNGQLSDTPLSKVMIEIRKRSAALENRLADGSVPKRPKLRVV